jgi:hypothetical protein
MNNSIWDFDFTYHGPQSVKVSCHAGDFPLNAVCNIIGNQPLFYCDNDIMIDTESDDDLLFAEDVSFPTDEKFLAKMRAKLDMYDKTAKSLSQFNSVIPEQEFDRVFKAQQPQSSLESIIHYGLQSGIFKSYKDFMDDHDIAIMTSLSVQTSSYNRQSEVILVNPSLDCYTASIAILKSMRMAWNHKKGLLINPLSFQPDEAVLINRLIQADMDVTVISYIWDLKLAGDTNAWALAMTGADYDLCAAYAMEAMTDFRSIKNGVAARSTFEKWFISGRCKNFDRNIIQTMMGGHTDIDIDNPDASRVIAMDVISGMGARPQGKNYLSPIVIQIMNDALYTDVRDRSNANFLWFVTFERRMANMEQKLHDQLDDTSKDNKDNIVSLPQDQGKCAQKDNKDGVASIFFLDHFRAG